MRQTIREIEVNVAYRWFVGYDFYDKIITKLADSRIGIRSVCDEFAEPVAKYRDLHRKLEPLI